MRNLTLSEVSGLLGWEDIGVCAPSDLPAMVGTSRGGVCLFEPNATATATNVSLEGKLGSPNDCAQEVPFIPEGSSYSLQWELVSVGKSWNGNPYYNYGFSGVVKTVS